MTDIDNQIATVKAKADSARAARLRAEGIKQAAQQNYDAVMEKLNTEFGVTNVAEAREKLAELQNELQEELRRVNALLDEINL